MGDVGTQDLEVTHDAGRLTVRFNRPQALNALTPAMLEQATQRVRAAADDPDVRVIVVTGEGRAFSSGADIASDADADADGGTVSTLDWGNALVRAIVHSPKPVVAAVNGLAAGIGATIALACDLHVTRERAYFLLAFANIGLMPDGGATAVVPAAIGRARASRMALLAERVPATQALDWGLISHVVDDDAFDAELTAVIEKLSSGPPLAYARTKAAIAAATLPNLDAAHALEREGQVELLATADFAEGVAAFRERRPARFEGR